MCKFISLYWKCIRLTVGWMVIICGTLRWKAPKYYNYFSVQNIWWIIIILDQSIWRTKKNQQRRRSSNSTKLKISTKNYRRLSRDTGCSGIRVDSMFILNFPYFYFLSSFCHWLLCLWILGRCEWALWGQVPTRS